MSADKVRIGQILKAALDKKGVSLKALLDSPAGKKLARDEKGERLKYSRVNNVMNGRRIPLSESVRRNIAALFDLSEDESALLVSGVPRQKPLVRPFDHVKAGDLGLWLFRDIRRKWFGDLDESGKEQPVSASAPLTVYIFATGAPLAVQNPMVSGWLRNLLETGGAGRRVLYIFPPGSPAREFEDMLDKGVGILSSKWTASLFSVVSYEVSAHTDEGKLRAFVEIAKLAPVRRMFHSFELGPIVFVLESEDGTRAHFTSTRVKESAMRWVSGHGGADHPPTLWVEMREEDKGPVNADISLLNAFLSSWKVENPDSPPGLKRVHMEDVLTALAKDTITRV
ncbi:MAG: hypothetical protein JST30_01510 [Armatimonadetes bacterium]|nr:hypothetical protein [Armatimonadota bacterium]